MTEVGILLLVIAIIVVLVLLFRRPRRHTLAASSHRARAGAPSKSKELEKLTRSKRFWGVEIQHPGCAEAAQLAGKEFSMESAPPLPLVNCSADHCTCLYKGLLEHRRTGRRKARERRDEVRFDHEHPDRRSHKDRRRTTDSWKHRDL